MHYLSKVAEFPLCLMILLLAVSVSLVLPSSLRASEMQEAETLIHTTCSTCHRIQGEATSRTNLQAPDLIGAGSKFQKEWLVGWLTGNEAAMYPKGYRWDQPQQPGRHMIISQQKAEAIAEYFESHHQDPRVKSQAITMSTFSRQEAKFGEEIFYQHSCIGCHQILVDGKRTGGPQSTSFVDAGRRLQADWIYRFNSHPPDFVPHSGEFVADVSELGLRYVTGFIATQGLENFSYYEPWTSPPFDHPDVERGAKIYQEYCVQCHGTEGKGDGPAASGLEPKPAIHANMAFEKIPLEYLYNVVYYGGKGVGKSPLMPYWGLTIGGNQGVADVIAYMKATFKGVSDTAESGTISGGPLGVCPQPRNTKKAPADFLKLTNPLPADAVNINAGKRLYHETAQPLACVQCHGETGDGRGPLGGGLIPPPRNFTCGQLMDELSDGQLFWIIKKGSTGTGMMAFAGLPDEDIWQMIHYIRTLAR